MDTLPSLSQSFIHKRTYVLEFFGKEEIKDWISPTSRFMTLIIIIQRMFKNFLINNTPFLFELRESNIKLTMCKTSGWRNICLDDLLFRASLNGASPEWELRLRYSTAKLPAALPILQSQRSKIKNQLISIEVQSYECDVQHNFLGQE